MDDYRVTGKGFKLSNVKPNDSGKYKGDDGKIKALAEIEKLKKQLKDLQEVLFAEAKQSLLVVIQAMDGSGKDSVVKNVFESCDPQGLQNTYFKAPSSEEKSHDYLWRIHKALPPRGLVGIFNRSHYEDVLITRVHGWVKDAQVKQRYGHIRNFESMLHDEGTHILKFMLNISKDEQAKQLQERIDTPEKRWKFNPGDLEERKLWDKYMSAYQDAMRATSTTDSPWYCVPGNNRWYRDLIILQAIVKRLESMKPKYPAGVDGVNWKTLKVQ